MVGLAMGLGAAASAIPEVFKVIQSGKDKRLGEQYLRHTRPKFRTPDEAFRAYNRLKMLSGQPLPGRGYIEEDIEEATSSGVRAAQELASPSEALGASLGLYGQQQDQKRALGIEEAMLRRQAQTDLANFETGVLAPYKEKEFDINQFQPYQQAQQAAAALLSSGEQNMFGGLEGMSRIGTTLAGLMSNSPKAERGNGGGNGKGNMDAFFGGNITEAGANELRGFGSNKSGLNFNYPDLELPADDAPYGYQPTQPGTVPFALRKYGKIKRFVP